MASRYGRFLTVEDAKKYQINPDISRRSSKSTISRPVNPVPMALPGCGRISRSTQWKHPGGCCHENVTRIFDHQGEFRCSRCYSRPFIGSLFRCTQDFNGFLPASDFGDVSTTRVLENDAQLHNLSPSIVKAVVEGHYTKEELAIISDQKMQVRDLVRQLKPISLASTSTASSSEYSLAATASSSTLLSSNNSVTDTDPDTTQATEYSQFLETIREVHDDLEKDRKDPIATRTLDPPCAFIVCARCYKDMVDRSWISLNTVLETPYRQLAPPLHEIQNKRVSNIDVVRGLDAAKGHFTQYEEHGEMLKNQQSLGVENVPSEDLQDTVTHLLSKKDRRSTRYYAGRPDIGEVAQDVSYDSSHRSLTASTSQDTDGNGSSTNSSAAESIFFADQHYAGFMNGSHTWMSSGNGQARSESGPIYSRRGLKRIASIIIPSLKSASYRVRRGS